MGFVTVPVSLKAWWQGQLWEHNLPLPLPDIPRPFPVLGQWGEGGWGDLNW